METNRENKTDIKRNVERPQHPSEFLKEWAVKQSMSMDNLAIKLGLSTPALMPMIGKNRRWGDSFIEQVSRLTKMPVEDLIMLQYRYGKWFRTQTGEE